MQKLTHRFYIKGRKQTISIRLPEELIKVLKKIAKNRGHGFSNFIQDGLDQWASVHEWI